MPSVFYDWDKMKEEISEVFNNWNKLKIQIHKSERFIYPKPREIWWVSLGQNIGVEINGKNTKFERPVVIIKVFNQHSILVAPISSKMGIGKYLQNFINHRNIPNVINFSQIRSLSTKRLIRKAGKLGLEDFEKIKTLFIFFM